MILVWGGGVGKNGGEKGRGKVQVIYSSGRVEAGH